MVKTSTPRPYAGGKQELVVDRSVYDFAVGQFKSQLEYLLDDPYGMHGDDKAIQKAWAKRWLPLSKHLGLNILTLLNEHENKTETDRLRQIVIKGWDPNADIVFSHECDEWRARLEADPKLRATKEFGDWAVKNAKRFDRMARGEAIWFRGPAEAPRPPLDETGQAKPKVKRAIANRMAIDAMSPRQHRKLERLIAEDKHLKMTPRALAKLIHKAVR